MLIIVRRVSGVVFRHMTLKENRLFTELVIVDKN